MSSLNSQPGCCMRSGRARSHVHVWETTGLGAGAGLPGEERAVRAHRGPSTLRQCRLLCQGKSQVGDLGNPSQGWILPKSLILGRGGDSLGALSWCRAWVQQLEEMALVSPPGSPPLRVPPQLHLQDREQCLADFREPEGRVPTCSWGQDASLVLTPMAYKTPLTGSRNSKKKTVRRRNWLNGISDSQRDLGKWANHTPKACPSSEILHPVLRVWTNQSSERSLVQKAEGNTRGLR